MTPTLGQSIDAVSLSALIAIIAPLVGIPLTVMTFYLRTIRDHHAARCEDTLRRLDTVETSVRDLARTLNDFQRDYTTKEEWLRESLHARRQLEHLTEMTARVQAELENTHTLSTHIARALDIALTLPNRPPVQDDSRHNDASLHELQQGEPK